MNLRQKIENDKILNIISTNFDNELYLVGGAVRNYILNKETYDRDLIVCDEDAKTFSLKLAETFDAVLVPLDEENEIYRIVFKDKINYIDITNPINNSLKDDLKRRDLTINAIAMNLKTKEIIDLFDGLNDLKNKKINLISEQNFYDDPLRIFRVFRFHANLGFEIDKNILTFIQNNLDLIKKPAIERISYEIIKTFDGNYVNETLKLMDECGLLQRVFPIISELKQVPPNTHHHLNLFAHSIETVKQITEIYSNSSSNVKEHLNQIDFGGIRRIAHLRLAGFLHDIGKFSTWTIEENTQRHRFIKHDDVGSKMVVKILKDLNFSNKQIQYIATMIKFHIYPSSVMSSPEITDKIMMRFVRKMDTNSIDIITLAKADRLSAQGPVITEEMVNQNISSLNKLQDFYIKVKPTLKPLPKLLDGQEVMKILNIKPSKQLGEIIKSLYEAQLNGDVNTYEEAVKFIKTQKNTTL